MAWALGQAVADLFARIAAALSGPTIGGVNPLPPSPPRPPVPPSPVPPGPPPGGIIPEPPIQGPPLPAGPPPIVVIEPGPSPLVPDPTGTGCEILSLADRIAIYGLAQRESRSQTIPTYSTPDEIITGGDMPSLFGLGTPLDAVDYFRFRAISTSDAVPVSFFGRIQSTNGQLVPFLHMLTTSVAGTLYETIVRSGAGLLLGAAASVQIGSITNGAVSAVGEIGRLVTGGFTPHTVLFSGQLDDLTPLSSTLASPSTPTSVPTFKFATMSAAVVGISTTTITPSTGKRIRICHLSSDYIASAVASNRQMYVRLRTGGATYHEGIPSQYIGANEIGVFRASLGATTSSAAGAIPGGFRELQINLPESLYFFTPVDVVAGCYGVQAGDSTAVGFIRYEET